MTGDNSATNCSDASLDAEEVMAGTASRVDLWMLLEYDSAWMKGALRENMLPVAVNERLEGWLNALPNSRLQFIKSADGHGGGRLSFFVVLSREREPVTLRFELDSYEDLLAIDVPKAVSSPQSFIPHTEHSPIYLVCTHGSYDGCCGRRGVPVLRELGSLRGGAAWQTTHLGGHRFAANLVCLPHGVYYGRVSAEGVLALVSDYENGLVTMENLRGRSCYPKAAQAAEYFLRMETGAREIDRYALLGVRESGDGSARIDFKDSGNGRLYSLVVSVKAEGVLTLTSCGDTERSFAPRFELVNLCVTE